MTPSLIEAMARFYEPRVFQMHENFPTNLTTDAIASALAEAKKCLTVIQQAGWRVVPVEATDAMIEAAGGPLVTPHEDDPTYEPAHVWREMIAAAPQVAGELG